MSKTLIGEGERHVNVFKTWIFFFFFPVPSAFFPPCSIQEKVSSYIHCLHRGMKLSGRTSWSVAEFDSQEPAQMESLISSPPHPTVRSYWMWRVAGAGGNHSLLGMCSLVHFPGSSGWHHTHTLTRLSNKENKKTLWSWEGACWELPGGNCRGVWSYLTVYTEILKNGFFRKKVTKKEC